MKKKLVAALMATALTVSACGNSADEPGHDAHDHQPPTSEEVTQPALSEEFADVDQSSPDEVGEAVLMQFFAWEPATDASPADAANRAEQLMDEEFFAANRNSWSAMTAVPGKKWEQWASANAQLDSVTVTESAEQRPPDTQMEAPRQYRVDIELSTDDGTETISYDVFATLTKLGWWRLGDMTISQPQFH
ncbi:hypothetical protein ACTXJY_10520 [Corynebacterium casei]|uniref:hypothetical protein n=1 Tax=Corynebacterium casei TaxID=160386 RepID=UPI003FD499D8